MERSAGSGKRATRTPKPPPRRPKSTGAPPPTNIASSPGPPPTNSPSSPGPPRPPAGPPPPGPPPRLPGGAGPPPPPQKGSGKDRAPAGGGGDRMRRAPEIVEFYQSLTKRGEARQPGSRGRKASGGSKAAPSDLIGEITKNSPHLVAVQADVETQGEPHYRPRGPLPPIPRPDRRDRPRSGQTSTMDYSPLRRARSHASTSSNTNLLVFLALAVTLAALLVLAGATLTVAFAAIVVLSPLLLLTSPLWVPVALLAFVTGAASLFACSVAVVALGAGTWAHRYLTGRHPVSAHRVHDARGRFADTGYYYDGRGHGRVKDAAPVA